MKFWTIRFVLALGVLLPALCFAQEPWIAPGPGYPAPGNPPAGGMLPPGYGNPAPGLYEELVPRSRILYDTDSRCDLTFKETFANTYVRLDYLMWQITGGRNALLGAPNSSGADLSGKDPDNLLVASDRNGTRAPSPTYAVVPNLPDNRDILNGLRGVFGIPTRAGTFESEIFYFEQMDNRVAFAPTQTTNSFGFTRPLIAATTLLSNGEVSPSTMILYSDGYQAREKVSFFGAESNWIFPAFLPNVPTTVSPILGFRYVSFQDKMSIAGVDEPDDTTTLNHYIGSIARNNIFGPQIGLRFSTTVGRLDLNMEPKFVAGINRLSEGVSTRQIYSPTEEDRHDNDTRTVFSPIFDLSFSTKLHLSERFAVYVAYDMMVAGGFSRAYNNVYYNSSSTPSDPPQISLRRGLSSFFAQGFAVGGELTFR